MLHPNLLVTDDDSALRGVLCESLSRMGFQVTQASDGEEAIGLLDRSEVHFCLVDFHMPKLNGLDVIQYVHTHRAGTPCVLMSADLNDQIRAKAEDMRAYGVLPKPIRMTELSKIVIGALTDVYGWKP